MDLLKKAERLLNEARALHQAAETRGSDLSTEERTQYDALMASARQAATDAEREAEMRGALTRVMGGNDSAGAFRTADGRTVTPETRTALPGKDERRALIVLPTAEYRDAQATTPDADGGYTIQPEVWSNVVDRLRPRSVLLAAQPALFLMTSSTLSIPKIGTGAAAGFVEENEPIPASKIGFLRLLLTARKLAARVIASSEWLADSAAGGGRFIVEMNLLREIATTFDDKMFNGDGLDGEPTGLLNAGVGVLRTAINGVVTLDDIAAAIGRVEAANATPSAIFMHPGAWASLRVERDSGSSGAYMLTPAGVAEDGQRRIFGVPVFLSAHLGTSVIVADMSMIAVGMRQAASTLYDPYSLSANDQVAIRVTSRWDIGILFDAAVDILTGVTIDDGESESA